MWGNLQGSSEYFLHLLAFSDNLLIPQLLHAQLGKFIFIPFPLLTRFLQLEFHCFELRDIPFIDNHQRQVAVVVKHRDSGAQNGFVGIFNILQLAHRLFGLDHFICHVIAVQPAF
jgi:hypothetical protein